jgi:hypothetical protein
MASSFPFDLRFFSFLPCALVSLIHNIPEFIMFVLSSPLHARLIFNSHGLRPAIFRTLSAACATSVTTSAAHPLYRAVVLPLLLLPLPLLLLLLTAIKTKTPPLR